MLKTEQQCVLGDKIRFLQFFYIHQAHFIHTIMHKSHTDTHNNQTGARHTAAHHTLVHVTHVMVRLKYLAW